MRGVRLLTILAYFVISNNNYGQSIRIKLENLKDTILDIENLSLKIKIENLTDSVLMIHDNLYHHNNIQICYPNQKCKFFSFSRKYGLIDPRLLEIKPKSNFCYLNILRDSIIKIPLNNRKGERYLNKAGKYSFSFKYYNHNYISRLNETIYSNVITFYVRKPDRDEKKLYEYLKKLENPEIYLGVSEYEDSISLKEKIANCEYILLNFEYNRLTPLIIKTYREFVKSMITIDYFEQSDKEQKQYYIDYLDKMNTKLKSKQIKESINNLINEYNY